MKEYCIEVSKMIVVATEAENYDEACQTIRAMFDDGEYAKSWEMTEPQLRAIHVSGETA